MATALKSVLRNPRFISLLKSILFGASLVFVEIGNFGIWPILFFIVFACLLFFKPLFQTVFYLAPFILFAVLSLLVLRVTPDYLLAVSIVFLSLLFYLFYGVKNLVFVNRLRLYFIFNLSLFYLTLTLFFSSARESGFLLKLFSVFLISAVLFYDLLKFWFSNLVPRRKRLIISLAFGFLVFEIAWAISLLPFGVLPSVALAFLIVFFMEDFLLKYFQNLLNRRIILTNITIFVLLMLLILMTIPWLA